jgi:NhaA family Na+:H+ antiporter
LHEQAVLGVLGASVIAAVFGYLWLRAVLPARRQMHG